MHLSHGQEAAHTSFVSICLKVQSASRAGIRISLIQTAPGKGKGKGRGDRERVVPVTGGGMGEPYINTNPHRHVSTSQPGARNLGTPIPHLGPHVQ